MATVGRDSPRARGCEWAIALGVFAASLAYFRLSLHLTLELRDEGYLFTTIARVANGAVPHRDFIDIYGPGVYAVTAPVFRLFGDEILPVRWLLAGVRAAAMGVGYLIAREIAPRSTALLGTLFAVAFWGQVSWILNTPYAALFTIPLCMLALLLVLRGLSGSSRRLLFAAGVASGAAVLFKQSLAGLAAYGMALAIAASALLEPSANPGDRAGRLPIFGVWLLAGALVAAPFVPYLSGFDYALHLMPLHLLVVCVGIGALRSGGGRAAAASALARLVSYGAGCLVLPLLVAALYLSWGALGDLVYDMFARPVQLRNYYLPMVAPRAANAALAAALVTLVSAGLLLLRGARRPAAGCALAGSALAVAGSPALAANSDPFVALASAVGMLPFVCSVSGVALVAREVLRPDPRARDPRLVALVAVLFFQTMMTFQIFPRGGYSAVLLMGTLGPISAYLLYRWHDLAGAGAPTVRSLRAAAALLLVAMVPTLIAGDLVRHTLGQPRPAELDATALHFAALDGVRVPVDKYERRELGAFEELIDRLRSIGSPRRTALVERRDPF